MLYSKSGKSSSSPKKEKEQEYPDSTISVGPQLSNGGRNLENARLAEKDPVGHGAKVGGEVQSQASKELRDPDVVDCEGPDDPVNPKNWSSSKKWANVYVLAAVTFFSPLISLMFATGVPQVQDEFHSSNQTLATFVVSVFLLG